MEIMALNDAKRNQRVCLQDRTLFITNSHSEKALSQYCKKIKQQQDRSAINLTQQKQILKNQYDTFLRAKKNFEQVSGCDNHAAFVYPIKFYTLQCVIYFFA